MSSHVPVNPITGLPVASIVVSLDVCTDAVVIGYTVDFLFLADKTRIRIKISGNIINSNLNMKLHNDDARSVKKQVYINI